MPSETVETVLSNDARWMIGRPLETVKKVSKSKKPQVQRGDDLADVERAIIADEWIGANQRTVMLRECRALAAFMASRREVRS